MNLPIIVEIIIGLVLIYISLSLLASEIEELLATLLQWRAEHLKRSIEVLLAGGSRETGGEYCFKQIESRQLANKLYDHPVIRNLNQESKGAIGEISRFFARLRYSWFSKQSPIFGDKLSGPSYIDGESFATTLLETLRFPDLYHQLASLKLARFCQNVLLKQVKSFLGEEAKQEKIRDILKRLEETTKEDFDNFKNKSLPLETSLVHFNRRLNGFLNELRLFLQGLPKEHPTKELLERRLQLFSPSIFGKETESQTEIKFWLEELTPKPLEVVELYHRKAFEKTDGGSHSTSQGNDCQLIIEGKQKIQQTIEELTRELSTRELSRDQANSFLKSVASSLEVLARRALAKTQASDSLEKFQREVATWFDRSMERASGVYKRNARGVAIAIGIILAVALNVDTIHIINKLSQDSALRATIVNNADQIVNSQEENSNKLNEVNNQVKEALKELTLPIGWEQDDIYLENTLFPNWFLKGLGWLTSGIAISMGASFWFDFLNRLVNVRNTGKKSS